MKKLIKTTSKNARLIYKLALSALLLLIIPLWIFIIAPILTKIPNDFSYKADVTSVDNFYNTETKQYSGEQFSKTKFSYEVTKRDGNNLTIKNIFDVQTLDGKSVFKAEPLYGIDAMTGKHVPGYGDKNRDGYLFGPKGLTKDQEFTYWHASSNTSAPMKYIDEEKLYGLTVYKYESNYGGEIDQTQNLNFLPDVGKTKGIKLLSKNTIWVEPVSGYLVKQEDSSVDYYYYELSTGKRLSPYNKFSNTFTEKSIQNNASIARQKKLSVYIYNYAIPIILTILILTVLVALQIGFLGSMIQFTKRYIVLIVVVGGLATLTFFSWSYVNRSIQDNQKAKLVDESLQIKEDITDRLNTYINALQGGKALFSASDIVSRKEWASYVNTLDTESNYPGVQGFGYAESVKQENKTSFIEDVRAEGFPRFNITPGGNRSEYVSIKYLEPFNERNRRAFGFDMFSEATRKIAITRARDTGKSSMSGKITLVQESGSDVQAGFLIYTPVYISPSTPKSVDTKRESIKGYVYSPFRANDFINGIPNLKNRAVDFKIYDGLIADNNNVLHDFTTPAANVSFRQFETIYIAGQPWTIEFTNSSNKTTISNTDKYAPTITVIAGIITTLLAFSLIYSITESRQKAVNYANNLNKDLEKQSKELKKNNEQLESKLNEVDKLNNLLVGREVRMIELKEKIKELDSGKKS